jgi:RNA polymerase sigma-70 factor (ECF subfamily)
MIGPGVRGRGRVTALPIDYMHRTDSELVTAYVQGGNDRAFSILVERHQERIFGYLLGMVRDRDVANDLFQETFIRAIRAMRSERATYSAQGKWLQWVMRIARNAALDHLRSRKRFAQPGGLNEDDSSWEEQLVDEDPDALDRLQLDERGAWLRKAIESLPEEQREVVLLRHDSELTFREIAELTDCSINTALGRMRYALINLRKILGKPDAYAVSGTRSSQST